MKNDFTTFYLTKMPTSEQVLAIENITNLEVSYVAFETPAVNVYSKQIVKLLEVKALLASWGIFIEEQIVN